MSGFTLIEVMIALALAALVGMIVFQSLAVQLNQVDTIKRASNRALEASVRGRVFTDLVGRSIPSWAEEEEGRFKGSADAISGVSASLYGDGERSLVDYEFELTPAPEGKTLVLSVDDQEVVVDTFGPTARFRFLSDTGSWSDVWPPPQDSQTPDGPMALAPSELPALVALVSGDVEGAMYVAAIESDAALPVRGKDLERSGGFSTP